MRIMAFDLGEKRTGVAISDELGITAQPLKTIFARMDEERMKEILSLIEELKPERIIIGLPINMDGSLGEQAKKVLEFVEELKKRTSIPVETWDERLTTWEAENILLSAELSREKRKGVIDTLSAQIILREYLDRRST